MKLKIITPKLRITVPSFEIRPDVIIPLRRKVSIKKADKRFYWPIGRWKK